MTYYGVTDMNNEWEYAWANEDATDYEDNIGQYDDQDVLEEFDDMVECDEE